MDDADRQARRLSRSFALFNNRHMADVAEHALKAADDSDGLLTTRWVAASTGLADSVVRPVMLRLVEAEILTRLPRMSAGRSAQYFRIDDADALRQVASLPDRIPVGSAARSPDVPDAG
mgnify:CR=1 FL=1